MKKGTMVSLRKKLLFFFLLIIVPLLLSGYFVYNRYFNYLLKKEIDISKQIVNEVSGKLDNYLWQIEQLSFDIAFNSTIQNILIDFNPNRFIGPRVETKVFQDLFGINRLDNNRIFYLKIANLTGEIGLSLGTMPKEGNNFDECFLQDRSLKILWSAPRDVNVFSDSNNVYKIISLYRWIFDPYRNIPIGIVRIDIDSAVFNKILSEYNYLSNSTILLVDRNGVIISGNGDNHIGKNISSIYNITTDSLFDRNDLNVPIEINDSMHYIISSSAAINGWRILNIIPSSSIEAQASSIKQYVLIVTVICISFSFLLSFIISFLITRPLNRLTEVMKRVRDGNIDVKFDVTTNDEIALLGKSFNEMTMNIKYLIQKNSEIQRQENISELLYLQSQINPHFLYNTLDSIRWTARKNQDIQVSQQIEMLSNMFRYYLNSNNHYVTFQKEVEHIKNYLEIQKFRFKDKITFDLRFDERLMDLYTIKLVLQPLVENSIIHGLENKLEDGLLSITGNIVDDTVMIVVEDNGIGTDQEFIIHQLNNKTKGEKLFALKNINDRLKLHFGQRYGIEFHSVLGRGTRVTLKLPILTHSPEQEEVI